MHGAVADDNDSLGELPAHQPGLQRLRLGVQPILVGLAGVDYESIGALPHSLGVAGALLEQG